MKVEKLLTVENTAKVLLVKPTTVREWLKAGKLKGMKMGRLWRVRESELEAFLREGERKSQISVGDLEAVLREDEDEGFYEGEL